MKDCYCCSGKKFADCCQPFLEGEAKPPTAEALMRSRFSAYAAINVEYLLKSNHPSKRKFHDSKSIELWAKSNDWHILEIISKSKGEPKDTEGTVEFKAFFLDHKSNPQIHHEISNFKKELGKWFYVDGKIIEKPE
jgi:SEC-C motif domain protein